MIYRLRPHTLREGWCLTHSLNKPSQAETLYGLGRMTPTHPDASFLVSKGQRAF